MYVYSAMSACLCVKNITWQDILRLAILTLTPLRKVPVTYLAVDESTDISDVAQLSLYVRFLWQWMLSRGSTWTTSIIEQLITLKQYINTNWDSNNTQNQFPLTQLVLFDPMLYKEIINNYTIPCQKRMANLADYWNWH